MNTFNVHILTPTTGVCRMGYTYSLVKMLMYFSQSRVYPELADQAIDFLPLEGSGISANREELVYETLKKKATHILFIDEDMLFTPNALHVLASKRKPVVGCNYPFRSKGKGFTALTLDQKARVVTGPNSVGLERVYYTGFGFCLIEREVFEEVVRPWFLIGYDTQNNRYTTEDVAFARLLQEKDIPWYCDHDASKLVRHVGSYSYSWEEAYKELLEGVKNG